MRPETTFSRMRRIFKAYFQKPHTESTTSYGLGLGLSLWLALSVALFAGPGALALENDNVTHRESQYLLGVHNWYPYDTNDWDETDPTQLWGGEAQPFGDRLDHIHDRGWLVHSGFPEEYRNRTHHLAVKLAYERGMTNIIRVNYKWDSTARKFQTVPNDLNFQALDEFAADVINMITSPADWSEHTLKDYAHIYVIGNEMNLEEETVDGPVSPEWYAHVFATMSQAIKSVQPWAKVLVAQPATWSNDVDPRVRYLWSSYYLNMLNELQLGSSPETGPYRDWVDGFALHTYGYHDPTDRSPLTDSLGSFPEYLDGGFRTFEKVVEWIDYEGFADKPLYITETNTLDPEGHGVPEYADGVPQWYVKALQRVRNWNLANGHRIRSLVWFQWYDTSGGFRWSQMWREPGVDPINDMDQANEDFRSVISNLYIQWPGYWAAQNADRRVYGTITQTIDGATTPVTEGLLWTDNGNYRTVITQGSGGSYELHVNGPGPYRLNLDVGGSTLDLGTHTFPTADNALDLNFSPDIGAVQGSVVDASGSPLEAGRLTLAEGGADRVQSDASYRLLGPSGPSATISKATTALPTLKIWASLPGYDSRESVVPVSGTTYHNVPLDRSSDNHIDTHGGGNAGFESGSTGWALSPVASYDRTGTWEGISAVGGNRFVGIRKNGDETFSGSLRRTLSGLTSGDVLRASALIQTRRLNALGRPAGLPLDAKVRLGVLGADGWAYSDWTESNRLWKPIYTPAATVGSSGQLEVRIELELGSQSSNLRAESLVAAVDDVYVMPTTSPWIEGSVRSVTGATLGGVGVSLVPYGSRDAATSTTTDAGGGFSLSGVLPGAYNLILDGELVRRLDVDLGFLQPGETRTGLDLRLVELERVDMWHVEAAAVTADSARIEVFTTEPSSAVVAWGTSAAYDQAELDLTPGTSHFLDLEGLSPGTTYHFQARTYDGTRVPAQSVGRTFITLSAPEITDVTVTEVTHESATVQVTTNVPTRLAHQKHGPSAGSWDCETTYLCSAGGEGSTSHTLTFPADASCGPLNQDSPYAFEVRVCDPSTGATDTAGGSFHTEPDPSGCGGTVQISNLQLSEVTHYCAVVHWTTDVPSNSCIWYNDFWEGITEECVDEAVTEHEMVMSLHHASSIDYVVRSSAPGHGTTCSEEGSFSTSSSMSPPYTVSNVQVENVVPGQATITFDTSPDRYGFVRYRSRPAVPYTAVHDGISAPNHSIVLTDLTPGETYSFYVNRGICPSTAGTTPGEQSFVATLGAPTIQQTPRLLSPAAVQGSEPSGDVILLSNTGYADLNYTIAEDASWLSVTPSSGTLAPGASQLLTVAYASSGLPPGAYATVLEIQDPEATNHHQEVDVSLTVEATGTVRGSAWAFGSPVSGAVVRVAGKAARTNALGTYVLHGVPVGRHTATCSHSAYVTVTDTVTVTDGGTTYKNWTLGTEPTER